MESTRHKEKQVMSDQALAALGAPTMVYVREVDSDTVREELAEYAKDMNVEFQIEPGQKLYALYAADGTRVAIMDSREAALVAARENEMTPVSVH